MTHHHIHSNSNALLPVLPSQSCQKHPSSCSSLRFQFSNSFRLALTRLASALLPHHFTTPPAMYEGSNFPTTLPTLVSAYFFFNLNFSHLSGYKVVFHQDFVLHFSNDSCWASSWTNWLLICFNFSLKHFLPYRDFRFKCSFDFNINKMNKYNNKFLCQNKCFKQ